jgi:hypothetical protein
MANFERSQNEVVSAQDGMYVAPDPLLLEPRRIHLRHVYPNPAVVLQFRDWSNNRTAVIPPTGPTDGNVPILRRGQSVPILAEIFGGWTEYPKGHIAQLMNQGLITVHEDYLGTTRQLSSGQVLQYQVMDNPWIDYVLHRLKTGTTADLAPTANVNGTAAVSHQNVKVKLVFDGGTTPTADVTGWNRSIDPTSPYRGSWTQDSSYTGVAGNTEMDFISGYGEVYIQLTSITGSPTSVQVMISGAPA